MQRTAIRSRDIAIVGYEPETATLEVAFRSGGVYQYFDVPEKIYQELLSAASHGQYLRSQIQDQYKYSKIA